eukprot:CAMPEP_0203890574 /NCGR_PEP_ID=MMETSP0359-20131031/33977_1 /ASSEMBLY_ACC=CAM_ASM_000338 /TAXON_ID=268821 /ORGANISM="Scrippsiella Hangoei, Strain SHTV-5" /LENGTH=309 /DNA_ID=CAMNT_0050812227 /DNA_START=39 /DNA_END=968 /DNA_ORIENTATION=+
MASLMVWRPHAQTVLADLSSVPTAAPDQELVRLESWRGMPGWWRNLSIAAGGEGFFSGNYWSRATAEHWEIPLVAVAAWDQVARGSAWEFNVRSFAFCWNAGLSLLSWCGVFACVPVFLSSLWEHGLYFTMCAPASWHGSGDSGFFVAFFVYSMLAELVDTVLLLLAVKPVIALQWWHHSAVLLYCCHSCVARIATGAWFAGMNFSVHSIMYGDFAVTGTKYRNMVSADAGWHVRRDQGRAVPGRGGGVPRQQDQLGAGLGHVFELLHSLLQALRGQVLLEAKRQQTVREVVSSVEVEAEGMGGGSEET